DIMKGKTVLVVGPGHIGKLVIEQTASLQANVKIVGSSRFTEEMFNDFKKNHISRRSQPRVTRATSIQETVNDADFIVFSVPYTKEGPNPTHELLDQNLIAHMKDGVKIIGISPAGIFKQQDVI